MGHRRKWLLYLMVFFIGYVIVGESAIGFAGDNDRVAEIKTLSGDVQVKISGGERRVKAFVGMALTKGDTLITAQNATVVLKSGEALEFLVAENTKILISELSQSVDGKSITKIELKTGGLWSRIKKALFPGSQYEVKTPTVVLGARGTEFYTTVFKDKVTGEVFVGTILVTYYDTKGNVRLEFQLPAGKRVVIEGMPETVKDLMIENIELNKLDLFALRTLKALVQDNPLLKPYLSEMAIESWIMLKTAEQTASNEAYQERLKAAMEAETSIEFYEPPVIVEPDLPVVEPPIEPNQPPIDNPTGGP